VPESFTLEGQTRALDPKIQEKLSQVRPELPDLRFQHRLHAGPAGEVICWLAEHHQCDLIVMGTHGRGGLTHLLFGSVAEYVIRNARCPVLTIRQQAPNLPPLVEPLVMPPPPPRFM
jgi:nucleotide-binding universal stress UspA family protein